MDVPTEERPVTAHQEGSEGPAKSWTLRGLSEEDMGALGLALQVRQEQAQAWEADRWARIITAVRQAVNEDSSHPKCAECGKAMPVGTKHAECRYCRTRAV
jgi:hypothetical protein